MTRTPCSNVSPEVSGFARSSCEAVLRTVLDRRRTLGVASNTPTTVLDGYAESDTGDYFVACCLGVDSLLLK